MPNNTHQLHAHSPLCESTCVTRRHFSLNAFLYTSDIRVLTNVYALMSYVSSVA